MIKLCLGHQGNLKQRAPDPRAGIGIMMVGLAAISGSLRSLELILAKWRCPNQSTSG